MSSCLRSSQVKVAEGNEVSASTRCQVLSRRPVDQRVQDSEERAQDVRCSVAKQAGSSQLRIVSGVMYVNGTCAARLGVQLFAAALSGDRGGGESRSQDGEEMGLKL